MECRPHPLIRKLDGHEDSFFAPPYRLGYPGSRAPALWQDILKWLEETIAPWAPERYRHNETGEDNAAAHLRSLTISRR
ncbi:MAG: YjbQ family protein [Gemmatimonadetes bacterium]|nr:YjbQ family protein [Gemmatimonadota bacterium]